MSLDSTQQGCSSAEVLGVHLDLERHQTRITNSRHWKVRLGLKALQRRASCTGKCLEVIIGHCTFLALVQLAALVTFHDVHPFIRKSCHTRAEMWPLVRQELDKFWGLSLLSYMRMRIGAPFSEKRFDKHVASGRKHAFVAPTQYQLALAHQVSLKCSVTRLLRRLQITTFSTALRVGNRTTKFAGISPLRLHDSVRTVRCSAPWQHCADILELEARVSHQAMGRACGAAASTNTHLLFSCATTWL